MGAVYNDLKIIVINNELLKIKLDYFFMMMTKPG